MGTVAPGGDALTTARIPSIGMDSAAAGGSQAPFAECERHHQAG
jgi:hypothetical protein